MNTPMPHGIRKLPAQPRITARITQVLNTCGEPIDEVGYDAVTTTLIAQRARVAVGSIYQFFTDKKSVMAALAARHLTVLLDHTNAALDPKLCRAELELGSDVIAVLCD